MIIDIKDEILRLHSSGLLEGLLVDKTTKCNIIWATDAYSEFGPDYGRDKEILIDLIIGEHSGIIQNWARKELKQQFMRTRGYGEVFTPLWICKKMNDYVDEIWFDKPDVFDKKRITFTKEKSWEQYVDSNRLEIACGEAPYLVSRYDVSTSEIVPIKDRVGILDRKLRVVNENTKTEKAWLQWVIRAFRAIYGYEFQGDNLLIARINLLMTFEEYLSNRWQRKPTDREYAEISNVIAWNIWQMNGLTGTIPYYELQDRYEQGELFDNDSGTQAGAVQPPSRIYDWRGKRSIEFLKLSERGISNEI